MLLSFYLPHLLNMPSHITAKVLGPLITALDPISNKSPQILTLKHSLIIILLYIPAWGRVLSIFIFSCVEMGLLDRDSSLILSLLLYSMGRLPEYKDLECLVPGNCSEIIQWAQKM